MIRVAELMPIALNRYGKPRLTPTGGDLLGQPNDLLFDTQATESPTFVPLLVWAETSDGLQERLCIESYLEYLVGLLDGSPIQVHFSAEAAQKRSFLVSTLFARQIRMPLRHILLVMRMDETDELTAAWASRLAQKSGAAVTILPIVRPLPSAYFPNSDNPLGIEGLLSPHTADGKHVRHTLAQLACNQVRGTLRLREGEPDWQLRQEIEQSANHLTGDDAYDLVIIGADRDEQPQQSLMGELSGSLLSWIQCPLLITRS